MRKLLVIFLISLIFALPVLASAESNQRNHKISELNKIIDFQEKFEPLKLGTVPLPPGKEMAYPYPDGSALLRVDFPSEVQVSEEFNIAITYQTSSSPFSGLILFHQMYIPGNTYLPTWWRQVNTSPWAPEDNTDTTGAIEVLPSVEWVQQNWNNWYGVGIAPMGSGNLLMHSSQGWSHSHYFWALDGDTVSLSYGPFSFNEAGEYQFEIGPTGWYVSSAHGFSTDIEPVSFNIIAVDSTIEAVVDIKPESFNLTSNGRFTAYIELPSPYIPAQIDVSSIRLLNNIAPLNKPTEIGDYDNDGVADLMVKFDRSQVQTALGDNLNPTFSLTGKVGQTSFSGSDNVNIIK